MTIRTGLLKRSPLKYVVASVRFAPWPLLGSKIAEIQDAIRDIAPLMHTIEIEQLSPNGQTIQRSGTTREAWMFMGADKSFGIQMSPDQLLLFTTSYTRFADFIKIYRQALDILIKHMRYVDVINMGARYIDYIKLSSEENLSDYISSSFLPPIAAGHKSVGANIVSEYSVDNSKLRVSSVSMPGLIPVPQDILGILMMIDPKPIQLTPLTDKELVFDMDAIKVFEKPTKMLAEPILEELDNLHTTANNFFRQPDVFTDYAFDIWKGDL
ncbi:TIGR04255 family protein [Pseudomonas fluorescens]|uniref:TIGR04255 family protein n=1 Tax=Pseudomonas TaxID=286 RepID=UPI003CFC2A7D